nr:hypothetical protein [uncultured Bacteroides sp.]
MRKLTKKSLCKLAKTMPVIEEKALMKFIGGGSGTSADPYTQAELDRMINNGTWDGGFVNNYGYVANDVFIYGNSAYPGGTDQTYYSFPDYITSLSNNGYEQILNQVIGAIPLLGGVASYTSSQYENMTRDIQRELLSNGYNASSIFILATTDQRDSTLFSVYDAGSGRLITSRTMDSYASWR